jgi:RecB family exonuclease
MECVALAADVASAYVLLAARPDVSALYASGEIFHEVPFTMRVDDTIVRGTIDCIVRSDSGRLAILEFKTGRSRPEHEAQASLYRQAIALRFPDATVEARVFYVNFGVEGGWDSGSSHDRTDFHRDF